MEREIVAGIKSEMDGKKFGEHFVDICRHRKTGGFDRVGKTLRERKFISEVFEPQFLVPAPSTQEATYTGETKDG